MVMKFFRTTITSQIVLVPNSNTYVRLLKVLLIA